MCGGRGTRLDAPVEKPLLAVCGEPMIEGVLAGLAEASVDRIIAAVSPHTPETGGYLREHPLQPTVLETPGEGYVADLETVLETVDSPVVSVVADLPLLRDTHVDRAIRTAVDGSAAGAVSVAVCVPVALKEELGVSIDTTIQDGDRRVAPTGLNVIGDRSSQTIDETSDPTLAVNVNRPGDVTVAEELCP